MIGGQFWRKCHIGHEFLPGTKPRSVLIRLIRYGLTLNGWGEGIQGKYLTQSGWEDGFLFIILTVSSIQSLTVSSIRSFTFHIILVPNTTLVEFGSDLTSPTYNILRDYLAHSSYIWHKQIHVMPSLLL